MAETAEIKAAPTRTKSCSSPMRSPARTPSTSRAPSTQRVDLTGIVLTRVDGDGRGGAALSMRAATGKPIKLIGVGEKMDALEDFHPEPHRRPHPRHGRHRLPRREGRRRTSPPKTRRRWRRSSRRASSTSRTCAASCMQMKKMGGMGSLMNMMPGMGQMKKAMAGANVDEKVFDRQIAIINSMTKKERANPDLLNAKRRIRIAAGSGTKVEDVNKLMKQHRQMADMMKKVVKGGMGSLAGMFGGKMGGMMPGLGNMPDPREHGPGELEALARQMGIDPASIPQQAAPQRHSPKSCRPMSASSSNPARASARAWRHVALPWPSRPRRRLRAEEEIDHQHEQINPRTEPDVPQTPPCPRRHQEAPLLPRGRRRCPLAARRPLHRKDRHLRSAARRQQQARHAQHRARPALAERRRPADRPRAALPRRRRPREARSRATTRRRPCPARRRPSAPRPRPRPPKPPPLPQKRRRKLPARRLPPPSKPWHARKPAPRRQRLLMGRIGAAHGIKGEVRIQSFTEDPLALDALWPAGDRTSPG